MTDVSRLDVLLNRAARQRPDHPAVVDDERVLTYAELHDLAGRIAALLRNMGVGPGSRVGLYLNKCAEAVAGIYGIMRAGAAYVPLDARAPDDRVGYIARDCDLSVLLTSSACLPRVPALCKAGAPLKKTIVLDAPAEGEKGDVALIGQHDIARALPLISGPDDDATALAYILYTSGSTGQPKGVMLTHHNGFAFVDWAVDHAGVTAADRLSSHAPFHFDLSVFDLYATALRQATLVLVPPSASVFPATLARWISDQGVTTWYSVPSILAMLVERGGLEPGSLPSLKTVIFAGEVFPSGYLTRLMRLVPHASFLNWYGPTETNVCTGYRVPEPPGEDAPDIPIGAPIAGVETFVVDREDREVGPGAQGELLVAGPTVMQGYWGDPDKTAARLVVHPAAGGRVVYRTGDLVEAAADGNLLFVGRRDNQIKSRGYRIELGEVETAIRTHPGVVEAAVVALPDPLVTNRLHAHVVLRDGTTSVDLARHCGIKVPQYMIPETWHRWDALPKTSTGKTDRQALIVRTA